MKEEITMNESARCSFCREYAGFEDARTAGELEEYSGWCKGCEKRGLAIKKYYGIEPGGFCPSWFFLSVVFKGEIDEEKEVLRLLKVDGRLTVVVTTKTEFEKEMTMKCKLLCYLPECLHEVEVYQSRGHGSESHVVWGKDAAAKIAALSAQKKYCDVELEQLRTEFKIRVKTQSE